MNFKEASGKTWEIWLKLELHGEFLNSANINRPCCHVWKVATSFSNLSFSYIERVTSHYQTLRTWIGLNVTRYCFWNLPSFGLFATCYHCYCFFLKNLLIYIFFINLTVARGNALQIVPNHAKLRENVW